MWIGKYILILGLLYSTDTFGQTSCALLAKIGQLELAIAEAIPDSDEFFSPPKKLELRELQLHYDEMKRVLELSRVKFESPSKRAARKDQFPSLAFEIEEGRIKSPYTGSDWLFEIMKVSASDRPEDSLPTASAYSHPKTQVLLNYLSKIGIDVYGDPTLLAAGYGG